MGFFEKFCSTIADRLLAERLAKQAARLDALADTKIYVESLRVAMGVSTPIAKLILETGVRDGSFTRHIEVLAPSGEALADVTNEDDLPVVVRGFVEEDGDFHEHEFRTAALQHLTYYRFAR